MTDANEGLMNFDLGGGKPLKKKPKLGQRRPKKKTGPKKDGPPKPWERKKKKQEADKVANSPKDVKNENEERALNKNEPPMRSPSQIGGSGIRKTIKENKFDLNSISKAKNNSSVNKFEEEKDHFIQIETDSKLDMKLISNKEEDRLNGFQQVDKWLDEKVTKVFFMKNLHLYVKEPEEEVLIHLLSVMKTIFYSPEAVKLSENLSITKFLKNYCQFLMSNAESKTGKDLGFEIIPLIFKSINTETFERSVLEIFSKGNIKTQSNLLIFLVEVLKAGFIKKLNYCKNIYQYISDNSQTTDQSLLTSLSILVEEMYLWIGKTLFKFLKLKDGDLKKGLNEYVKSLSKEDMKIKNFHGHQVLEMDPYQLEEPQDIPKEFFEEKWSDDLVKEKSIEKKKEKLNEFNEKLLNIKRLNTESSNPKHLMNMARQIFLEGNMDMQIEVIKMIGNLANTLREHFEPHSRSLTNILFMKLKDKNSRITETIIKTMVNIYKYTKINETIEEYKEHLFDRSHEKKKNILAILIRLIDKKIGFIADTESEDSETKNIVKMLTKLLEEGDSIISNKTSELIAKLLNEFGEPIRKLISDAGEYWKTTIDKFCKKFKSGDNENEDMFDFQKKKTTNAMKDKIVIIRELREELFLGKVIKLNDTEKFRKFLNTKLKILSEITNEFSDLEDDQLKEIYLLIEELVLKIDKESICEESKEILVSIYFKQSNYHSSTEMIRSMQFFIDSVLITPREFLNITYDLIRNDHPDITTEFLANLIRLMETELLIDKNLTKVAHEEFIEFMETHYSYEDDSDPEQIYHILCFMRTIEIKFGINNLENYPEFLINQYQIEKKSNEKALKRFLNKMTDKRRKMIEELIETKDPQRIKHYFNQKEFLNYLKRLLIQEMDEKIYSFLVDILEKYLILYQQNKEEFSLKNYLFVFQIIINNYANIEDAKEIYRHTDTLFHKTIKCLSPNVVFYELLQDQNNMQMKEDILNFYLIYHTDIQPNNTFMKWLAELIDDDKELYSNLRRLIEDVLLMLKATEDDELIDIGNENKNIKDIWHKNEENMLFDRNILYGESIFESISRFRMIKKFIIDTLGLDEAMFYSKTFIKLFSKSSEFKKVKIVFYLIKSYENTNRIAENIFYDIENIEWRREDEMTKLIVIKILFNLLKNKVCESRSELFINMRKLLKKIAKSMNNLEDDFKDIYDFNEWEEDYFNRLIFSENDLGFSPFQNDQEDFQGEAYQPEQSIVHNDLSNIYAGGNNNQTMNTTLNGGGALTNNPLQSDYQSTRQSNRYGNTNQKSQKSFMNSESVINENKSTYGMYNEYEYQSNIGNNSQKSKYSKSVNNPRRTPVSQSEIPLDNMELLSQNLDLLTTFDFDQFQEGTDYINKLLNSMKQNPNISLFIIQNSNNIVHTYVRVFEGVMPSGINFQLGSSHYKTIFEPFLKMIAMEGVLSNVNQSILDTLVYNCITKLVITNQEKEELENEMKFQKTQDIEMNLKTAQYVTKSLNSITLKLIQKCEINFLLKSLFNVLIISRGDPGWPSKTSMKSNSLSAKCIIRSFKKIEGNIPKLNPENCLSCVISYTTKYEETHEDQNSWKACRMLINEIIKNFPENVVYNSYEMTTHEKENIVSKWISSAFQSMRKSESQSTFYNNKSSSNLAFGNTGLNNNFNQQDIQGRPSTQIMMEDPVHEKIIELIKLSNRETRKPKVNALLREICKLLENNKHINFEIYEGLFVKQKYFKKIFNHLYMNDNISDIQSVISSNTRTTKMDSAYDFNSRIGDNMSIRSINKSPNRQRKY